MVDVNNNFRVPLYQRNLLCHLPSQVPFRKVQNRHWDSEWVYQNGTTNTCKPWHTCASLASSRISLQSLQVTLLLLPVSSWLSSLLARPIMDFNFDDSVPLDQNFTGDINSYQRNSRMPLHNDAGNRSQFGYAGPPAETQTRMVIFLLVIAVSAENICLLVSRS
jgi:hypothetical protein